MSFSHCNVVQFSKTFLVDYFFEEIQHLKFITYDIDDPKHVDDIKRHDLIGEVECTLADIVTAGQQYKRTLRKQGQPHLMYLRTQYLQAGISGVAFRCFKRTDHYCS